MKRVIHGVVLYVILLSSPALAWEGESGVVVSIKPLHSLVAAIMQGSGESPQLLVDGTASLHTFTLKPSQVAALNDADIIFYISDDFELFMPKVLKSLPDVVQYVSMDGLDGLTLYPVRLDKDFKLDAPAGKAHVHKKGETDMHFWLMPANAKRMVTEIAQQLSDVYPDNATLYAINAQKLLQRLDTLDLVLKSRMKQLAREPFVLFHDATQYFERAYKLQALGSITMHPEQPPGAKRLSELRAKIKNIDSVCVFREPAFEAEVITNLLDGTSAKSNVLDPEGVMFSPGPDLYFQVMEGIAYSMEQCFLFR